MAILETVKIDRPEYRLGYVIINKSDFDANTMKLYGAKIEAHESPVESFESDDMDKPKRGRPAKSKE